MEAVVRINDEQDARILHMTLAGTAQRDEINAAFEVVRGHLDTASSPLFVVMDLTGDPILPVLHTSLYALPAFVHRNLRCWLVVGENQLWHAIERTLVRVSHRADCVQRFHSLAAMPMLRWCSSRLTHPAAPPRHPGRPGFAPGRF